MSDVSALIRFRKVSPSNEPLGEFVEVGLSDSGFQDVGGIAASGDDPKSISVDRVANTLLEQYDRADLIGLLAPVAALYAKLAAAS